MVFGELDLDLRAARFSRGELTLAVWSVLSRVTVTVPAASRLLDEVLVAGHRPAVSDDEGTAGGPVIRLRGIGVATSFRLSRG